MRDSTSSHRARQPAQDRSTPVCVRRTILLAHSTDVARGCTLTCAATAARHTTFHLLCLRQRTERASQGSTSLRPNFISHNMQNRAALEGSMVKCLVGNVLCACVLTSTGVQLQTGATKQSCVASRRARRPSAAATGARWGPASCADLNAFGEDGWRALGSSLTKKVIETQVFI